MLTIYLLPCYWKVHKKKRLIKDSKEIKRCSCSRSCSLIKEYVLCNDFDYFFTLTIKDDIKYNYAACCEYIKNSFKEYARRCKRQDIEFKYIYVFEKTKKGALHVHGFISGLFDLYLNKYGYKSSLYFDHIGFQNYSDSSSVNAFYLIKYIIKSPIEELPHNFYKSRNLKKADISYIHDNFAEFFNLSWTFENQFCKMISVKRWKPLQNHICFLKLLMCNK